MENQLHNEGIHQFLKGNHIILEWYPLVEGHPLLVKEIHCFKRYPLVFEENLLFFFKAVPSIFKGNLIVLK